MEKKIIGVVGGVGPYAGLDLVKKIFDQTKTNKDQDYLPVILSSKPHLIEDRTKFLIGESKVNPGFALAKIICELYKSGVNVVGIPCNTAHARPILTEVLNNIPQEVKLVDMTEEVIKFIKEKLPHIKNIGLLSTTGIFISNVYDKLVHEGFNLIKVPRNIQDKFIQPAIYDEDFGIKAKSNPVTQKARQYLFEGINYLEQEKAEVIILACTEIPYAITQEKHNEIILLDSTKILARALIKETYPSSLDE